MAAFPVSRITATKRKRQEGKKDTHANFSVAQISLILTKVTQTKGHCVYREVVTRLLCFSTSGTPPRPN